MVDRLVRRDTLLLGVSQSRKAQAGWASTPAGEVTGVLM